MDFWISEWISGFQSGFLDFRVDFWISDWISGFHSGFLDFWISQWISGFQFGFLPTVYEISFVTDPSVQPAGTTFGSAFYDEHAVRYEYVCKLTRSMNMYDNQRTRSMRMNMYDNQRTRCLCAM